LAAFFFEQESNANTMRLTKEQINTIVNTCRAVAGLNAIIWIYGSRLDDSSHGGDIDLLIEPVQTISLLLRARIKMLLEQKLCIPVEVLVKKPETIESPFVSIARAQAQQLETIS
jgi:predicted nucleotidyltransferase